MWYGQSEKRELVIVQGGTGNDDATRFIVVAF